MAERRCFSRKVVESDAFRMLPEGCQALYLHLNMAADDDGFINCAGSIAAVSPNGKIYLEKLVEARFLLRFEDVYVVKHWRISNSLKSDRMKDPAYPRIAEKIYVNSNRAYTLRADCGGRSLLEIRAGKVKVDSQEKIREEKIREGKGTEENADFAALLEQYPVSRRGNESRAEEVFCAQIKTPEQARLALSNLEYWKRSEQWNKNGGQFVPYLVNWLDRGCWAERPVGTGASGILGEPELMAIKKILEETE